MNIVLIKGVKKMYKNILILFLISCFCLNVHSENLEELIQKTSNNYKNVLFTYDVAWTLTKLDHSEQISYQKSSDSQVTFIFNNENYLIFTKTKHSNGVDDETSVFYYWTPSIYYEYMSGYTLNGAKYKPVFDIHESNYNPITLKKSDKNAKKPFVFHHQSWGIFEPITSGLLPFYVIENSSINIDLMKINITSMESTLSTDLSSPYFEKFLEGEDSIADHRFTAELVNSSLGIIVKESSIYHKILSSGGSLDYTINFTIDELDELGFPKKGQQNFIKIYLDDNDTIEHRSIKNIGWDNMKIKLNQDIKKIADEITDSLEIDSVQYHGNLNN